MNPLNPNPWVTSPTYWRVCATAARWGRRSGLVAAAALAVLLLEAVVLAVAEKRGAAMYQTSTASQTAWTAAWLAPAGIILGRLERDRDPICSGRSSDEPHR